jgi:hypothetical protein
LTSKWGINHHVIHNTYDVASKTSKDLTSHPTPFPEEMQKNKNEK